VALRYNDAHPWWQVDLGQVRQIGRIEISPRTDWCPSCMYPYMVIVSDYPIIDSDITDSDSSSWVYLMRVKVGSNLNKIPINRSGRYVRIALQNQNYLQLAEVKVIEQFNSAQARSATQSSTPYVGYDASRAVDGVTTGDTSTGDVAITNNETKPWWQVDMGFVQPVREVHIWSSNVTCCASSNPKKGLYVFASTSPITADPLTKAGPPSSRSTSTQNTSACSSMGPTRCRCPRCRSSRSRAARSAATRACRPWGPARGPRRR
jgi:hypothetical protein